MKILPNYETKVPESIKERLRAIDPATIGHYLHFGFMDPRIQSRLSNVKVVGQAVTVKTSGNDGIMVHKGVSMAGAGDVVVIDRNGDTKHACIGGVVAYAAKVKNLAAIIIDGPSTDIQEIKELGVPVFSTGLSPITTKIVGNIGEINTTVQCGGVSVSPGDLIHADDNGVIVFSQSGIEEIETVLQAAEQNGEREVKFKENLDKGNDLSSLSRADKVLREKGIIK